MEVLNCIVVGAVYLMLASEGDFDAGYWSRVPVECSCDLGLGLGSGEGVSVGIIEDQVNLRDV